MKNKNVLCKVVNVCCNVTGKKQASLHELYECCVVRKAQSVLNDNSHVLAQHYKLLVSGRRFRVPRHKTLRAGNSFIPCSVRLLNG